MNKQINDLKGKALDQAVPYTWHHLNQVQMDDVLNKFAEFIVKECIGCCEQVISDPVPKSVDTWLNGGSQCIDQIKQHFGVEE